MSLPLAHYVSDEAFDPEATVAPGSGAVGALSQRLAGPDHLVALPAAPDRRISLVVPGGSATPRSSSRRSSRPTTCTAATRDFIYRAAAAACISSTRDGSSGRSSIRSISSSNLDTLKREYTPDRSEPQPIRFFCSGEHYSFWDLFDGDVPSDLPAGGRDAVPARHRPARARHVLAPRLRRAHLAHHRPGRRHAELHDRHHHRRHGRLFRRPLRFRSCSASPRCCARSPSCRSGWRSRRRCR